MDIKKVGVVGCGLMGAGIAQVAAQAGYTTVVRELNEELGIRGRPVRAGKIVVVQTDWGKMLHVHPFLFEVGEVEIGLDWEHTEFAWIAPHELYNYDFVKQLDEDLMALGLL